MECDALSGKVSDLIAAGVMEIGDGYRAKNSELGDDGFPFARAANINGGFKFDGADRFPVDRVSSVGKKLSRPGDVVFTSKGTVGRFAFVDTNVPQFVYSPQLCYWRSLEPHRLNPRYLYFWMQSQEFLHQIGYLKNQTDMADYVSLRDQREITLTIPTPDIQRSVADFLGAIESRIDLLRQTNTTLEAIAQALFKSWFVDFDPVHAKAEGRDPEAMDAATAALFPSEFEESELGPIPKGWRAGTLDDLSHLNANSWSSKRHPDAVIYVDLSGVHENRIGAVKELPYSDTPSRARRSLRGGDTIVGTVRPGNRAFAYIHHPAANLTGSTGFAVLSPKDEALAPFVYLAATRDDSIERLASLADGGAYPAVRPNVVSATPVVIPPASIITAFSRITAPMLHKIGESRDAEATLVELRDTLLPRLMSGKLRLPESSNPWEQHE